MNYDNRRKYTLVNLNTKFIDNSFFKDLLSVNL